MEHLKYLSWANYFLSLMALLSLSLLLVGMVVMVALTLTGGGEVTSLIPSMVGMGAGSLVLSALVFLHFLAGRGVAQGKRRTLQTVMAVLSLPSCPGVLYGAYALWVCWSNGPSRQAFDDGGVF